MGSGRGPGKNGGPMMYGQRGSAASAPPPVELKLQTRATPWTTAAEPDCRPSGPLPPSYFDSFSWAFDHSGPN